MEERKNRGKSARGVKYTHPFNEFGFVATAQQHWTKMWPCSVQSGAKLTVNEETEPSILLTNL